MDKSMIYPFKPFDTLLILKPIKITSSLFLNDFYILDSIGVVYS